MGNYRESIYWILDNVANTSWKDGRKDLIEYFEENKELMDLDGYKILTYSDDSEVVGVFEDWFDKMDWGKLDEAHDIYLNLLNGGYSHIGK